MDRRILGIALVLGAAGLLGADSPRPAPLVENIRSLIDRVKLEKGAVPVRLFAQGEKVTVNVVTPKSPLPAHYHAEHEEVVYIVRGLGTLSLDGVKREVRAGDIVYIPIGTVHSFRPGSRDCQALSIFAPAFDGKDRVFVKPD